MFLALPRQIYLFMQQNYWFVQIVSNSKVENISLFLKSVLSYISFWKAGIYFGGLTKQFLNKTDFVYKNYGEGLAYLAGLLTRMGSMTL